jgi:hypothetical protein
MKSFAIIASMFLVAISVAAASTDTHHDEMPENKTVAISEASENKAVGLRGASPVIAEFQDYVKESSREESTCRDGLAPCSPTKVDECCSGRCLQVFIIFYCG